MRRIGMLVLVALMLTAGAAMAENFEIPESVVMSASKFEGYTPKKADVTFNHASHMHIACADCHHTVASSLTIESCTTEGCHDNIATRGETNSVYTAFHTGTDTTKSCVGCHRALKKSGQGDAPLACNSCHVK